MIVSTRFTHADLLVIPDDGKLREIVDGELFVTPSPNLSHQRIARRLQFVLLEYLKKKPVGELLNAPLDVILSDFDVLEPDLLLVLNEHRDILQDWVRGAPDLVVEILSPTTATRDRGPKMKVYARFGVEHYWIVDPDQESMEIYRLTPEGYQLERLLRAGEPLTSSLLAGFSLPVGDIFHD